MPALPSLSQLGLLRRGWDIWQAPRGPLDHLQQRQKARLADLVRFARVRSPFYRQLYRDLPPGAPDLSLLPPVTKRQLMADFDQVVTDPAVRHAEVEAFVADHGRVGQPFLQRYRAFRSSGSTGEPGIFLHDPDALAIYRALSFLRGWLPLMSPRRLVQIVRLGDRVASVVATGAHFPSTGMLEYQRQHRPPPFNRFRVFPIQLPLAELTRQLNDFQPAELIGYPSALVVLALEQQAGRLKIRPALVGSGGEWLPDEHRQLVERAFGCLLRENYGAAELPQMVWDCRHARLHVSADWAVLEPVDQQHRPVPPGQTSHTTLITNLANRIQPLIRYDLGDQITVYPDPCRCGSPLPAIRVEGRQDDTLVVHRRDGQPVLLPPLAIGVTVYDTPGLRGFQVIQREPNTLCLRLEPKPGADPEQVWAQASARLRQYLAAQQVPEVQVLRSPDPPLADPHSGKFRYVWSELATGVTFGP